MDAGRNGRPGRALKMPAIGSCSRRRLVIAAACCGAFARAGDGVASAFVDPLDAPAMPRRRAPTRLPMTGIAAAGAALVAVGPGGLILRREPNARTWVQAAVPASCDLTAVQFPTADTGWCVGHDGLVLRSADGGRHWERALDGRRLATLLTSRYATPTPGMSAERRDDALALAAQGPVHPWLDVCFVDERRGWIVGAFGLVIHTRDGGLTWEPWLERVDNPRGLHLYGLQRAAGELLLVGEQGLLMRLDEAGGRFTALDSPYPGSLFGVVGSEQLVVIYGMRGSAWVSRDRARSWTAIGGILPLGVTGGAAWPDGRVVLVTQAAQLVVIDAAGLRPRVLPGAEGAPYAAAAALPSGRLGVVGSFGVAEESLAI